MAANPWGTDEKPTCVVLAAGRGSRMSAVTEAMPKVLVDIHGRPAIHYVIDYWKRFTDRFVFIVGYKKEMVIDYVSGLGLDASFAEQKEMRGIAHAITHAEDMVGDKFVVALGDCLCKGEFAFPTSMDQGFGIVETANERDIMQSYSVEMDGGRLLRVVEKPKVLVNNLCGMGFYFFRKKLFVHIRRTPPSALRGEVEITDVIQSMVDAGEPVSPVRFEGAYINLTFPEDVERASRLFGG